MSPPQAALKTRIPDDADRAEHCANVLKRWPLRLRIVAALRQGRSTNALAGGWAQPAIVSQQLRPRIGLVEPGAPTAAWYRLLEPNLKSLVACMDRCSI
jgi:hypothetical protein